MSFLQINGLTKQGKKDLVLNHISFTLPQFHRLAIAGETGSGKSTLLKIIAGLVQADTGTVILDGERILGPAEKLVPGHASIAYLSQHFELPHSLRVEQALAYANALSEENAALIYQVCRIDHLLQRRTDELSGGERQRIAIARLLIASPRLLLLDEPYSNLDMVRKSTLKEVIRDVGHQLGISCILVSHDPDDTLPWADEIIIMKGGEVVQKGSPQDVYLRPINEYAAGLLGKFSVLNGEDASDGKRFVRPEGFEITKNGQLSGNVLNSLFMGSHFELEVSWKDEIIIVRSFTSYPNGETIFFNVKS
jgi:iron(III) transport system ATP-binding protein